MHDKTTLTASVGLRRGAATALLIGVAILLGYAAALNDYRIIVAIVAVAGAGVAITKPYWTALMLLLASFIAPWLVGVAGAPIELRFIEDALSICLCLALAYYALTRRGCFTWPRGSAWLGALGLAMIVSALISESSNLTMILSIRSVWKFVPLFFAPSVFAWSKSQLRLIVWTVVVLVVIQTPVALVQFVRISTNQGDAVGGTLGVGASGVLTTLVIGVVVLLIGICIYVPRLRVPSLVLIGLLCIPPALNETKAFFIAAPLIWGVTVLPKLYRRTAVAVVVIVFTSACVLLVAQAYSSRWGGGASISTVLEQSAPLQWQATPVQGSLSRVYSVYYAFGLFGENAGAIPFGFGSGSLHVSEATGDEGFLITDGILLKSPTFGVKFIVEYGIFASAILFGLLISVFRSGRLIEKNVDDAFLRAVGLCSQGLVITMIIMSFYTTTFTSPAMAASFWTTAGVTTASLRWLSLRDSAQTSRVLTPSAHRVSQGAGVFLEKNRSMAAGGNRSMAGE